jgi:hypothetical protein
MSLKKKKRRVTWGVVLLVYLGIELLASPILGKHSTTELHLQPRKYSFCWKEHLWARKIGDWGSKGTCLSLLD